MIVYNAKIVDCGGTRHGWIKVTDGKIEATGEGTPAGSLLDAEGECVDARGAYLIPGLVDTHVHFREPGLEYKGNIESESLAAVAGGVVTVFDMPNTKPATTTELELANKVYRIERLGAYCRVEPLMGLVPGAMQELKRLYPENNAAVKLFLGTSTGAMASPDDAELGDVFHFCADHGLPIIVHAEDNDIIARNMQEMLARYGSPEAIPVEAHEIIRSGEACLRSSERAVELAERYGTRLHLAHVSTAEEVENLLSEGPTQGKLITAETTPLYLESAWPGRNGRHKVNPAIKGARHAEALAKALVTGAIDTIATDHAPHLLEEKMLPGITAMSGAPSVQFALPVMLRYLPIETVVRKMTAGPRDVFGLRCTTELVPGAAADFVMVEECEPHELSDSDVLSQCRWTPFAGITVRHRVAATWIDGVKVWDSAAPEKACHAVKQGVAIKR